VESGWTIEHVRARATERIDSFCAIAQGTPYENKGILYQEALFLYACLVDAPPRRVIESGRARGQSTLMLGLCFPESTIISIELDRESRDAPVAQRRLACMDNVRLHYGNAREVVPAILENGDIVVIDGPKEHRALALAYRVLMTGTGLCPAVFVHDCYQGSPIRNLIDSSYPGALYSDDRSFVAAYGYLDENHANESGDRDEDNWRPHRFAGRSQVSWGPTFACLPYQSSFSYGLANVRVRFAATCWRLRRSLAKRRRSRRYE